MGPLPEDLKKKIMSLHPGLTEGDFAEYLRLQESALMIDPLKYPERKMEADKAVADYVKKHMPRLEEAVWAYSSAIESEYEEAVKRRLADPVELAKTNKAVREWLKGRAGAYRVGCTLIQEPYTYLVEFKSPDGSEIHARVDRYNSTVSVIFQRTIK